MTWYDLDLGREGTAELDLLLSRTPFTIKKEEERTLAYFHTPEEEICIMSYTSRTVFMYHGVIATFGLIDERKVYRRLKSVKSLKDILENK